MTSFHEDPTMKSSRAFRLPMQSVCSITELAIFHQISYNVHWQNRCVKILLLTSQHIPSVFKKKTAHSLNISKSKVLVLVSFRVGISLLFARLFRSHLFWRFVLICCLCWVENRHCASLFVSPSNLPSNQKRFTSNNPSGLKRFVKRVLTEMYYFLKRLKV